MTISFWIFIITVVLVLVRLLFKLTSARCTSKVTLLGKTALVTGGSSGIGYQLAKELASRGCRVILAQRTTDEELKKTLIGQTNNPHIYLEHVDFSSFNSVRDLVGRLKSTITKLDILVNNAGIGHWSGGPTKDGFNHTFQINYYSSFLLTYLLVDLLKRSDAGRIVFTSSITAYFHSLHVKNYEIKSNLRFLDYPNTKFLAILAADYFAQKLRKFGITCNSYHPGVVGTPIFEKSARHYRNVMDVISLYGVLLAKLLCEKTTEEGVQTVLYLAIADEVANVTGEFFGEMTQSWKPRTANNQRIREMIWKATEKAVGLTSADEF